MATLLVHHGHDPRHRVKKPARAGSTRTPHPHAAPRPPAPLATTARLTARLVARGAVVLAASLAGYVVVEVLSYRATYPGGASDAAMAVFDTPAIRMLQGPPEGIGSAGGFTAWDGGWFIGAVVAVWSMLVVTRLLRGEEDDDRVAALLAGPMSARRLVAVQLTLVAAAAVLLTLAVGGTLVAMDEDVAGSALFGLTVGGFAALWAAVAAVAAQVLDNRRRALGAASAAFALAYVVRLVANSTEERAGLRTVTPWGWLDEVQPFAGQRLWPVAALWGTAVALGAAAVALRGRRDTAGAFLTRPDRRAARLRWLGGPTGFAWRQGRGVLAAWAFGIAVWCAVLGGMLGSMLDVFTKDENYRAVLESMGLTEMFGAEGFVAVLAVILGLVLALFAAWRVGAARAEEASGRLESVLVRPVTRRRWALGHVALALLGVVALAALSGLATWVGASMSGADLGLPAAMGSGLNQVPVAVLFVGIATLLLGVAPRLTLTVPASLAALGYVVELVGPALDWPGWLLDLSPFHHLAYVPVDPFAPVPALVLVGLGLCAAAVGVERFRRRDVVGG